MGTLRGKGEQLQMFMRPGEILGLTEGRSVDYGDRADVTASRLKGDVLARANRRMNDDTPPIAKSVLEEGVKEPIILTRGDTMSEALSSRSGGDKAWMGNGHHRLASSLEAERVTGKEYYVPVIHDDDYMGSSDARDTFGIAQD